MKKRIFALALALCMMLSAMPTSFAGNGFLTDDSKAAPQSGVLTDDSKAVSQSGVLTGASKYYRQDGILYNTGSQSGASYSLPGGTLNAPTGILTLDENVDSTTTLSGSGISAATRSSALVTDKENGLELSKKVTEKDGTYTITLEAYTTGEVTTSTVSIPSDIILVLDVSGSMGDYITVGSKTDTSELDKKYGADEGIYEYASTDVTWQKMRYYNDEWQYWGLTWNGWAWKNIGKAFLGSQAIRVSKLNALKISTQRFVDSVAAKAMEDNVDHRIAIISYANNAAVVQPLVSAADKSIALKNSVLSLTSGGATAADYGMSSAKTVLSTIDSTRISNKVVIMFTDGEPNHSSGFVNDVANATISNSKEIKGSGATVYTIGVFENADDTVPMPDSASSFDKYMHFVSSNFKTASSMSDGGVATYPANGKSYYLAASNATDLNSIFQTISQTIQTPSIDLGSTTEVRDAVSPYFDLPANAASKIKLYTAAAKADGSFEDKVSAPSEVKFTIFSDNKTVSVTGFDFNKNFVSNTAKTDGTYGKKLIIEIPIEPKTGFLGGNGVPTNDDANAGIYLANNLIENFPNTGASTNVDIADVTVDVTDKNIYLSQTVSAEDLVKDAKITIGDNDPLDMTKGKAEGYGLASWKYDFVDIEITSSGTSSDQTNDFGYTVTCTVKPKPSTGATAAGNTKSASGWVNVFKPVVTFQDSTIYLGTSPTYEAVDADDNQIGNYQGVVWKHGKTDADSNEMGTAPELAYRYDPSQSNVPTDCVDVNVNVAIDQNDVTDYVTFTDTREDEYEFTVHVVKPVITSEDITIYLSNTVDLNGQMTEVGNWVCGHTGSEQKSLPANNGETRLAPTIDYTFMVGSTPVSTATAYQPLGCTEIKATATVNGKNAPISTDTAGKDYSMFQIHVLKPTFTVACTDLWADYGTLVDVDANLATQVVDTDWSDTTENHSSIPTPDVRKKPLPETFTYTYTVTNSSGTAVANHMVTENDADFTVELASFKIGTLDCGTRWSEVTVNKVDGADSNHNFTIHTNKFDLTINKTWKDGENVAEGTYKQDAIFTVSGGLGKFQVVLPAGQESITVKNLLCGQDYTVTEDSNWTWRWKATAEQSVNCEFCDNDGHHDVNPANPHDPNTPDKHGSNAITFENILNRLKTKWFDFCKLVMENIFGVGSFERRGN